MSFAVAGVLSLLAALAGCDRGSQPAAAAIDSGAGAPAGRAAPEVPFRVVTTTAMIADIVANVAGVRARVESLMGPGVDPHLYRPTRDDMSALLAADVVFYNGLNLEGKMTDAFVRVARTNPHVHAVTDGIQVSEPEYLLEPPGFQGHYDPHVWMDPRGWIRATRVVVEALGAYDPSGASTYEANGDAYASRIEALDAWARGVIATIPPERRVLVTAHDAFNYFARAYNVEVRGIQGISTESEAGLRRIQELVDLIVERGIAAVFIETSVSEKNIRTLVENAAARGHTVRIGGALFSDAMGRPGTYEGTYVGMIDHNVTTIVRALGGEAPATGSQGKLSAP